YRIPFAFLLYLSTPTYKQRRTAPNLNQRIAAAAIKTIVETLPLWMVRSIFNFTGVLEQIANGMYVGEQRNKWCQDAETEDVGENADMVILYAHGGGLNVGEALISLVVFVRWIKAWKISHGANTHIISLEYGLAPEHVFPSHRDTSLELLNNPTAYNAPLPSRLLLISPCVSALTTSHSFKTNYDNDCISMSLFYDCLENTLGHYNIHPTSPQISPLFERHLRGLPKVWICVGGYEVFLDDIVSLVEKARSQEVSAELLIEENNMHNYAILWSLSRNGGAQRAMKYMSRFLYGEQPVISQKTKG
ncbi:11160_t:CDS:2, partial [Racocetra persica]